MVLKNKSRFGCMGRWVGMLLWLPMWANGQEPMRTALMTAISQKIETHTVSLKADARDRVDAAFLAEGKIFFFRLTGTGASAHTINTDDPLIFLLQNDSTVTLKATAVQGFDDLDTGRTYKHEYTVLQQDLEMLRRNPVQAMRKYTVIGFDDFALDEAAAANLQALTGTFLQMLGKEGLLKKVVVTEPAFPGGRDVLLSFLTKNLKPLPALSTREQKRATVEFMVDEEGRMLNIIVKQSAGTVYDAELLRILSRMPRWKTGLADGSPVKREVTLQLIFQQVADKVSVSVQ